jgi:hypothetical protein
MSDPLCSNIVACDGSWEWKICLFANVVWRGEERNERLVSDHFSIFSELWWREASHKACHEAYMHAK